MRLQAQLYIDVSENPVGSSPNYRRLDLFDFEEIELTSSIQDVKDISKVFTDYSQQFSLPASNTNNDIFIHYYNNNIENGFDARIKRRAIITLNGITFRDGYLRLNDVIIKDGTAYSYKVVFFGALTMLKDVIGDDELSDLSSLSRYDHDYNNTTVFQGFNIGLGNVGGVMSQSENRDIIYPSITARDKWFYDSSGATSPSDLVFAEGQSVNLYDPSFTGTYGINYLNLKPAIKLKNIIDAIEERYESITFSQDFFSTPAFTDLYLLLHNTKGYLSPTSSPEDLVTQTFNVGFDDPSSDFKLDGGSVEQRPITTRFESAKQNEVDVQQYDIISNITVITPASGSKYTVEILDGIEVLSKLTNVSGNQTITATVCSVNERQWKDLKVQVSSSGLLNTYSIDLELKKRRYRIPVTDPTPCSADGVPEETTSSFYSTSVANQTFIGKIEITQNIPKFKILDLLKGIFKTFNLTSYLDENGVIVVKPLLEYYNEGSVIDITRFVDNKDLKVSRRKLYDNISFKWKEPKTFGIINKNEVSQVEFGDLNFQSTEDGRTESLVFDGGKYEVKTPFEKLYYERFSDENDLTDFTPLSSGWLADKDQNPTLTSPIIFYNVPTDVNMVDYEIGFQGQGGFAKYNRASNISGGSTAYSLHFGIEYDEYFGTEAPNSLFKVYYDRYVRAIFSKLGRTYDLKMYADLGFLITYNLNDTLSISGKEFFINSIRTNLSTGETSLQLIDTFDILDDLTVDNDAPTVPTGLALEEATDNSLVFSWDASTDNVGVVGYEIHINGSLLSVIGNSTRYVYIADNAGTSYDVQVLAFDAAGNKSALTSIVSMSTLSLGDTKPPKRPINLKADVITLTSIDISWDASIDNVGVTGYEVFVDGLINGSPTGTTYSITGLTAETSYEIKVRALDAAGNESDFSDIIRITTGIIVI